jgi:hypoxanthine phosphoribosyltransferase
VRTSYAGHSEYAKRTKGKAQIDVHGLRYVIERVASSHTLLIVDDVYGTGRSVEAVIDKLRRKARRNMPRDIRIASVWVRPVEGVRRPDYYVHEATDWLVLPYELADLSPEEIAREKPAAARAIKAVHTARAERMGG